MIIIKGLLLSAIAILQVKSASIQEPKDGYVNLGGKKYYFDEFPRNHTVAESEEACKTINMKLIAFDSMEKEQMIIDFILQAGILEAHWTSGRRISPTEYMWESTGQVFTNDDYTNWHTARDEPNFDGDCIVQTGGPYTKKWWDYLCNDRNSYICEEL